LAVAPPCFPREKRTQQRRRTTTPSLWRKSSVGHNQPRPDPRISLSFPKGLAPHPPFLILSSTSPIISSVSFICVRFLATFPPVFTATAGRRWTNRRATDLKIEDGDQGDDINLMEAASPAFDHDEDGGHDADDDRDDAIEKTLSEALQVGDDGDDGDMGDPAFVPPWEKSTSRALSHRAPRTAGGGERKGKKRRGGGGRGGEATRSSRWEFPMPAASSSSSPVRRVRAEVPLVLRARDGHDDAPLPLSLDLDPARTTRIAASTTDLELWRRSPRRSSSGPGRPPRNGESRPSAS